MQLIALFAIVQAAALAWLTTGASSAITPALGFVGVSILFINVGFALEYSGYSDCEWADTAVLVTSAGLLTVAVSATLAVALLRLKTPKVWIRAPADLPAFPYRVAVTTALGIYALVLLYFYAVGYIPLVEGLRTLLREGLVHGLVNTYRINRDVYVNPDAVYVPLQGLLEIIRYCGLPITAVWFTHFLRAGVHPRASAALVVVSASLTVLSGQRWPLMYLLATLLVYWSWTEPHKRRFRKVATRVAALSMGAGIILSALLGRSGRSESFVHAFGAGLRDLWTRIIAGSVQVPFLSYELFPSEYPFLFGQSWLRNLEAYLPGPLPSFPVVFSTLVTGAASGATAPPDFYTESYINFGWIGVFIVGGAWGVVLAVYQHVVAAEPTLLALSTRSLIVTLLAFSSVNGITWPIGGFIVVVIVLVAVRGQCLVERSGGAKRARASPWSLGRG